MKIFYPFASIARAWVARRQRLKRSFLCLAVLTVYSSLITVHSAQAQDYVRRAPDLDRLTQELFAEIQSDEIPYEDLYETLLQYYQTPINLNTATREELRALLLLNENQISALLAHRAANGDLLSVYELQSIEGYDLRTINRILPFVGVLSSNANASRGNLWQRIAHEDNNALYMRYERVLQQRQGYYAAHYLPGPAHHALPRLARQAAAALPGEPHQGFQPGLFDGKGCRRAADLEPQQRAVRGRLRVGAPAVAGAGAAEGAGPGRLPAAVRAGAAAVVGAGRGQGGRNHHHAAALVGGRAGVLVAARKLVFPGRGGHGAGGAHGAGHRVRVAQERGCQPAAKPGFAGAVRRVYLGAALHGLPPHGLGAGQPAPAGRNRGRRQCHLHQRATATWPLGLTGVFTHYGTAILKRPEPYNQFEFSGQAKTWP